jgi:transcriptional regulator with XRE-family HTH domain
MTVNPLARHRRLGTGLSKLRDKRGYTHADLSAKSGVSASVISRIENPFSDISRRPDLRQVRKLLDALGVPRGSEQFAELEQHAEYAEGGWWRRPQYAQMGLGQRDYAIVEYGASVIQEYGGLLIPGLAQTAAYARLRSGQTPDVDAIVAGRMERQRVLETAAYELVLEEQAVLRHPGPGRVMAEQLLHLIELANRPNISLRILRVDADLGDEPSPRMVFAHIDYPDRDDPELVMVDGGMKGFLVTEPEGVARYVRLHQRLHDAARSDADSAAFIRQVADSLMAASI